MSHVWLSIEMNEKGDMLLIKITDPDTKQGMQAALPLDAAEDFINEFTIALYKAKKIDKDEIQ